MNIASLLNAVPEPDRPAIIFSNPGKSIITFRELDDLSSRLAEGLYKNGLRANDLVVLLAPISLNLYASLIALFKLRATAVFLDPQTEFKQLDHTLALVEASALICTRKALWLRYFSAALRGIPRVFLSEDHGRCSLNSMARSFAPRGTIAEVEDETPALVTFTSGSTDSSGPRGVIRTHRLLIAQHNALSRALPMQMTDVDLPAFSVVTLHNLASGITSVLPDFPFRRPVAVQPEKILRQINMFGVTTASGAPAYWTTIVKHCLRYGFTLSLRRIITGGASVSPALIQQLRQVAPKAEILNVYGSTEAEPVAVISAAEFLEEATTQNATGAGIPLGRPVSDICVRIRDGKSRDQTTGQVGEIWVSGDHVARNYFANPDAESTNKRFDAEGRLWHRMGDVGHMDEAGRLWLDGRVNTIVMRDGTPIYPVPVETLAATMPFVYRAALIGVPDGKLGERSALIVEFAPNVMRPNHWQGQLQALCAERGWIVDELHSIHRLPVDARHNSRIDYERLKSRVIGH
jgi:acyl-CoA synthetase (AMP-forming)/AMP-acid ligase II